MAHTATRGTRAAPSPVAALRGQYARLLDAYTALVTQYRRLELALEVRDHEATGLQSSLRRRFDD